MGSVKEKSPDSECILLAGDIPQEAADEAVNLGAYSYARKPYDIEQLQVMIHRAIEKREMERRLRESERRLRGLIETSAFFTLSP